MFGSGQVIGPYTLIRELGHGQFGIVCLAEETLLGRHVALKLPKEEDGESPDLALVRHEAQTWLKASGHPNIVPVLGAGVYNGQIAIASEYIADGTLAAWMQRNGGKASDIATAAQIVLGILAGLEHLHGIQPDPVIHRDLKPANVLMDGMTPRITDFGVSRVLKTTVTTVIAGTPAYMAPEMFDGRYSPQSDLWAVGVIFYKLLTGTLPFEGANMIHLSNVIKKDPPRPLPESVPTALRKIIFRAIEKNPARRFGTVAEMRTAVQLALQPIISNPALQYRSRVGGAMAIAGLYAATLVSLTGPLYWVARLVDNGISQERPDYNVFASPIYWTVVVILASSLFAVLRVSLRISLGLEVTRRSLLVTTLVTGIWFACLSLFGSFALLEAVWPSHSGSDALVIKVLNTTLECGAVVVPLTLTALWLTLFHKKTRMTQPEVENEQLMEVFRTGGIWKLLLAKLSRRSDPKSLINMQTRLLCQVSATVLLVCVPLHAFDRRQDNWDTLILTFLGIATTVALILLWSSKSAFSLMLKPTLQKAQSDPQRSERPSGAAIQRAIAVVGLYFVILLTGVIPISWAAWFPLIQLLKLQEYAGIYASPQFWFFVIILALSEYALLHMPVRLSTNRSVSRRRLLVPTIVSGFWIGCLTACSLGAFPIVFTQIQRYVTLNVFIIVDLCALIGSSIAWSMVFYRRGIHERPQTVIERQIRFLQLGSILELLLTVPLHVAFVRQHNFDFDTDIPFGDWIFRHFLDNGWTFFAIIMGLSVLFLSFGPALFFRHRERLHERQTI